VRLCSRRNVFIAGASPVQQRYHGAVGQATEDDD
jgi:hypothetical protein